MDEKKPMNKKEFMDAVLREISNEADAVENAAAKLASLLWVHYCAFLKAGFNAEQSIGLAGVMLSKIMERAK